jgi:hypothetical protein
VSYTLAGFDTIHPAQIPPYPATSRHIPPLQLNFYFSQPARHPPDMRICGSSLWQDPSAAYKQQIPRLRFAALGMTI